MFFAHPLAVNPQGPRVDGLWCTWQLERGAYHTGYYVYVSVDGTTWPDEDTGYIATWQDEFTTQYTMDAWAA